MKVVILTGYFGMGHVSAANAIRDEILSRYPEAEALVIDIFTVLTPDLSKSIYWMFNFWTKYCPALYNSLNAVARHVNQVPLDRKLMARIRGMLAEHNPDCIVSTLPQSSQYMSAYKKATGSAIPLITYVTDIIAHEEWVAPHTDQYYVGAQTTKRCLIEMGVAADDVTVSGIPVRQAFKALSYPVNQHRKPEVLVMGGGLGLIPLSDEFFEDLSLDESLHVTLIAGKNRALQKRIREKFPQVTVVGYTRHPERFMRRADVLVTKSGGITTFEAIYARTPLYVLEPFLAQERGNADFIVREHIGMVAQSEGEMAREISELAHNAQKRAAMKAAMLRLQKSWEDETVAWIKEVQPRCEWSYA